MGCGSSKPAVAEPAPEPPKKDTGDNYAAESNEPKKEDQSKPKLETKLETVASETGSKPSTPAMLTIPVDQDVPPLVEAPKRGDGADDDARGEKGSLGGLKRERKKSIIKRSISAGPRPSETLQRPTPLVTSNISEEPGRLSLANFRTAKRPQYPSSSPKNQSVEPGGGDDDEDDDEEYPTRPRMSRILSRHGSTLFDSAELGEKLKGSSVSPKNQYGTNSANMTPVAAAARGSYTNVMDAFKMTEEEREVEEREMAARMEEVANELDFQADAPEKAIEAANKIDVEPEPEDLFIVRAILLCEAYEQNPEVTLAAYAAMGRMLATKHIRRWLKEWEEVVCPVDIVSGPIFGLLENKQICHQFHQILATLCLSVGKKGEVHDIKKAVHPLLMVLRDHEVNHEVQSSGFEALSLICAGEGQEATTSSFLVSAMGGFSIVTESMRRFHPGGRHSYTSYFRESVDADDEAAEATLDLGNDDYEKLQLSGTKLLALFAHSSDFHDQLISSAAIESVLDAIRELPSCAALVNYALIFLKFMCEEGHCEVVVESWGGVIREEGAVAKNVEKLLTMLATVATEPEDQALAECIQGDMKKYVAAAAPTEEGTVVATLVPMSEVMAEAS